MIDGVKRLAPISMIQKVKLLLNVVIVKIFLIFKENRLISFCDHTIRRKETEKENFSYLLVNKIKSGNKFRPGRVESHPRLIVNFI